MAPSMKPSMHAVMHTCRYTSQSIKLGFIELCSTNGILRPRGARIGACYETATGVQEMSGHTHTYSLACTSSKVAEHKGTDDSQQEVHHFGGSLTTLQWDKPNTSVAPY